MADTMSDSYANFQLVYSGKPPSAVRCPYCEGSSSEACPRKLSAQTRTHTGTHTGTGTSTVCVCSFGPTSLRVLALLRFVGLPQIRQHMGKEVPGREAAPAYVGHQYWRHCRPTTVGSRVRVRVRVQAELLCDLRAAIKCSIS